MKFYSLLQTGLENAFLIRKSIPSSFMFVKEIENS